MLQRTVQRPVSRLARTTEACHQCKCRCGASFQAARFSSSPVRRYAAKAPITRDRERKQKGGRPMPAEYGELKAQLEDATQKSRWLAIAQAQQAGHITATHEASNAFLNRFSQLCAKSRSAKPGGVQVALLQDLLTEFEVSDQDALYMALLLLQDTHDEQGRMYGQRLLFTLSAAGFAEASIRILNHALIQSQTSSTILRSSQVATARGHLHKFVREGSHPRATVLEGKIAYKLGDEDNAIKLWWEAMDRCIRLGNEEKAQRQAGEKPKTAVVKDFLELSTPWVELIESHYDRSMTKNKDEWQLCEKAIEIGLEQDDPTAFYYAATYYKQRYPDGTHLPTSLWLYYMTKAAVSGVPKACYELGVYYAESGWKYIEDEPPDHVKPTPFDSHPAESSGRSGKASTLRNLLAFFQPAPPALSERDSLFHSGAFPHTPEQRLRLAKHWLEVAASYTYAPSYLYLARLHLLPTLWAGASAPTTALNLSPERYSYRNAEEKVDAEFTGQAKPYTPPEGAEDPINPIHDEEAAKAALGEIFHARNAVSAYHATLTSSTTRRRSTIDYPGRKGTPLAEDDFTSIDWKKAREHRGTQSMAMIKYFQQMDVFHMWERESAALVTEAAGICEERGWDLWDTEGGLLYRRGVGMVQSNNGPVIWN